uniref:Uncharacterized protein n=1 Tax=uncultured bacterium contig00146 TaxID=1181586 RepID=A0A806KRN2_9BACT|nr:hypothetical protein [uncultured bacterium contig00146]
MQEHQEHVACHALSPPDTLSVLSSAYHGYHATIREANGGIIGRQRVPPRRA